MVEIRCPVGPGRLFTKLRLSGEPVRYVLPDNVIEMACSDCRRQLNRDGTCADLVLHRYNFLGDLVATVLVLGGIETLL